MRRALLLSILVVALLAWPAAASAAELPDCDPATNPAANHWDGEPGLWSDPQRWSLGHVPTAAEDACAAQGTMPGVDVDIHVRSILAHGLTVSGGTTLRAGMVGAGLLAVASDATVRIDGTGLVGMGEWAVSGTVHVDGGATLDASLSGTDGTMTLRSDGAVLVRSIDARRLFLTDATRLATEHELRVRESLTGTATTSVVTRERGTLHLGTAGTSSMLDVDVTGPIWTSGNVLITDARLVDTGLQSAPGSVELRGVAVTGSGLYADGAPLRITGNSLLDVEVVYAERLELTSCTSTSQLLDVRSTFLLVRDLSCIDPGPGVRRSLGGGTPVRIDAAAELRGGGVLDVLSGVEFAAGARVELRGTSMELSQSAQVAMYEPGVATIVGLAAPDAFVIADAGQLVRIEEPRTEGVDGLCLQFATARAGGRVEVHTASPRPGCVMVDVAEHGSQPVRYVGAGAPYEPRRMSVALRQTRWTPDGVARASWLTGSGTVAGSVDVDNLGAFGGTMSVTGHVTARSLDVGFARDGSHGVIDLRQAASQQLSGALELDTWPGPMAAPRGAAWTVAPGIATSLPVTTYRFDVAAGSVAWLEPGTGIVRIGDLPPPPASDPVPAPPEPTVVQPIEQPPPSPPSWISWTGTAGNDRRSGLAGNDTLRGRGGADVLRGLGGNDLLDGGTGNDVLDGGAGHDLLLGGGGRDRLLGGTGNDRVHCGAGWRDLVLAGSGSDVVSCRNGRGGDVIDCGAGRDLATVDRGDVVRACERVVRR